jgi:hypothetical protein
LQPYISFYANKEKGESKMKKKLLSMLTVTMLLLGFAAVLHPASAFDTKLEVLPAAKHFWSDVDYVGESFEISIWAINVSNFYGWELVLKWTPGIVNCTGETPNLHIWSAHLGPWIPDPINNTKGEYHQSVTGSSPAVGVAGDFWLTNLTFVIAKAPDYAEILHTAFHLQKPEGYTAYCLLGYSPTGEIPHDYIDGDYYFHWAPPTQWAYLEVSPSLNKFTGKNIYKTPFTFSVDIMIKNVVAGWKLAGTEFVLNYNTSVLDVLSVTVGDFFEPFFNPISPPQTFNWSSIDEANGQVAVAYTMLDIPHMLPPYGEGKVATITFNATLQEKFPTSVKSPLDLDLHTENGMTSYFINFIPEEIPYSPEVDGSYELAGYVIGRVIDVYTQYPDPYGGQGPQAPSDMFWPQKQVDLYANVTYNEWPVQQKAVAFEVKNNFGTIMTILTGVTNENGTAHVSFRMDWPCTDPEQYFGVWTVTATVDIACIVVNDTLQFHYDYLVHFYKITTTKTDYAHCENVNFNVTFGTYAMQHYLVYFSGTIHDELNYPVITGTVTFNTTIGWGKLQWCQRWNSSKVFSIHVDKSVVAGEATIHVSALYPNLPNAGGYALCPEITKTINILPKWA